MTSSCTWDTHSRAEELGALYEAGLSGESRQGFYRVEVHSGDVVEDRDFGNRLAKAPVAEAGGPYAVPEGGSVQLDASGTTDPDLPHDALNYAWDFDGDGQYDDAIGVAPEFSAVGLDGPGSVIVGLQVTDRFGASSTDAATVAVSNVVPTALLTAPESITYGNTATLSFADPFDPSSQDTTAGFHYAYATTVDGFSGVTYDNGSSTSATHDFTGLNAGDQTLYGRIMDQDDGFTQYATVVHVEQAALDVTANDRTKTYGDTLVLGTTAFTTAGLVNGDTVTSVSLASAGRRRRQRWAAIPLCRQARWATGWSNYTITTTTAR